MGVDDISIVVWGSLLLSAISYIYIARRLSPHGYAGYIFGGLLLYVLAVLLVPIIMYLRRAELKGDWRLSLFPVLILAAGFLAAIPLSVGFDNDEIAKVKGAIRSHFASQAGVSVDDVVMMRDTKLKLAGYIKYHIGPSQYSSNCEALMDGNSGEYFWRCGR